MFSSGISISRCIIIFVIGVMFIHTIAFTSVDLVSPSDLGLASRLPITFWIGLVLLGCLWFLCLHGPAKYQIVALVFTLLYLYFVPAIVKKPVWISESFYPFGESVKLINPSGHLDLRPDAPLVSYHSWPLFLYFASALKLVTGVADSVILRYFPLLTISLYGLFAFLILRVRLRTSYSIFGAAWFVSSLFIRQQYFGPQGIAYILFLLIVFLVTLLFFGNGTQKNETLAVLFVLFFMAITLTHALTSLIVLVVTGAAYLTYKVLDKVPPPFAAQVCMFSAIFLSAYNLFVAQNFFNQTVETLSEFLLGAEESSLLKEPSRLIGSEAQILSYYASWGIVVLTCLIAAVQVFFVLKEFRSRKRSKIDGFSLFGVIWLAFAVLFAVTAVYGSHEAYQRAFMFGLIPITYLCLKLLSKKPRILLLILVGLAFLNLVAQYGSDTYRLATDKMLAGSSFLVRSTPQDVSYLYGFYPHVRYHDPLKRVQFVEIRGTLPYTRVPNATAVNKALSRSDYIVRSDLQRNYYLYFFGEDPFDQVSFDGFNRIYDNAGFEISTHANRTSSV